MTRDTTKMMLQESASELGKLIRRYFVEMEKVARKACKPLSQMEMIALQAQVMVDQERRLRVLEQVVQEDHQHRVSLVAKIEALPAPTVQAKPLTTRGALRELVERTAEASKAPSTSISTAMQATWRKLYHRFRTTDKIDLPARAKNRGMKTLDYAEKTRISEVFPDLEDGSGLVIDSLYACATDLFVQEKA